MSCLRDEARRDEKRCSSSSSSKLTKRAAKSSDNNSTCIPKCNANRAAKSQIASLAQSTNRTRVSDLRSKIQDPTFNIQHPRSRIISNSVNASLTISTRANDASCSLLQALRQTRNKLAACCLMLAARCKMLDALCLMMQRRHFFELFELCELC